MNLTTPSSCLIQPPPLSRPKRPTRLAIAGSNRRMTTLFDAKESSLPRQVSIDQLRQDPAFDWYIKNTGYPTNNKKDFQGWAVVQATEKQFLDFKTFITTFYPEIAVDSDLMSSIRILYPNCPKSRNLGIDRLEEQAIRLFTSNDCMLFYIALMPEDNRAKRFLEENKTRFSNLSEEEILSHSLNVNIILAHTLRKLPNFEGTVYRGTQIKKAKLNEWYKENKIIFERGLSSFTKSLQKAMKFSLGITQKVKLSDDELPCILILKSHKSKDISCFSIMKDEEEVLYAPFSLMRCLSLSNFSTAGRNFALIYLEEVELKQ